MKYRRKPIVLDTIDVWKVSRKDYMDENMPDFIKDGIKNGIIVFRPECTVLDDDDFIIGYIDTKVVGSFVFTNKYFIVYSEDGRYTAMTESLLNEIYEKIE